MSIRKPYPHHVPFKRTNDWYDSGGTWYQVSTWCTSNFGRRWDYSDGKFMFETEKDKVWFLLRYSS